MGQVLHRSATTTEAIRRAIQHSQESLRALACRHGINPKTVAKWRKGSKVHIAVDTLGHLLALTVTPASAGDREQVAALAEEVQQVTGNSVELAYVDQGYTGPNAAEAAAQHGLRLEVVKHPMAKRGFVLLPRRWVVERSFAWAARFRRLARDYERLDTTLKGLHLLAFATLMLRTLANTLIPSS